MKKISLYISIGFVISFIILFILASVNILSERIFVSASYAGIINLLNILLSLLLFNYSYKKSNKIFLVSVLGGMSARMIIILLSVFMIIKFLNIDIYAFIFVFFVLYFALLLIEVMYFNRYMKLKTDK